MSVIIINLAGFPAEFPIYKFENGSTQTIGYTDKDNAGNIITNLCYTHDIFKVHISGLQEYADDIADDIRVNNTFTYDNKNTIEIEVN